MAVVNRRTYKELVALVANGETMGGTASFNKREGFRNFVKAPAHGSSGPQEIAPIDAFTEIDLTTQDILKAPALLIAAATTAVLWGFKSGTGQATMTKHTVKSPVFHRMSIRIPRDGFAEATLNAGCQFTDTDTHKTMHTMTEETVALPTDPLPGRQLRCRSASIDHDESGKPAPQPILHVQEVTVSLEGRLVDDSGDTYEGVNIIEVADWNRLGVSLTIRDAQVAALAPLLAYTAAQRILGNDLKADGEIPTFTAVLGGVGLSLTKTLTLRNVIWGPDISRAQGPDWTGVTLTGECQFHDAKAPQLGRVAYDGTAAGLLYFA